jgi:hypothetical protein
MTLVGRGAAVDGGPRHIERAKHIVENALGRVGFHHRHMFVGRGVEHRGRAISLADFPQAARIGHTAQQGHQLKPQALDLTQPLQFLVNGVETKLVVVQQQQLAWRLQQDLPAQLTADAAARPRHQHHFARQIARQQGGVGRHRVAPEQILDIEFLEVLHRHPAAGQV